MEKNHKKSSRFHLVILASFAIIAGASGSASKVVNSEEFQDGFEKGWEFGKSLRGADNQLLDTCKFGTDGIELNNPIVASND